MARVGRPTKYNPEMCATVIAMMSEGYSKESVCRELGIHHSTFIDWQGIHPEFSAAVKEGDSLSAAWWQDVGRDATLGNVAGFNATAWIFNMKNRFGWRDRQEIEQTVTGKHTHTHEVNPVDKFADILSEYKSDE